MTNVISSSLNRSILNTYQKLSSGKRINSAADDAAGLAISQKMNAQITAAEQGVNNLKDANNLFRVSEGALDSITKIAQDIYHDYMRLGNRTLSEENKKQIESSIALNIDAIDGIANTTNFNGIGVFNGSSIQVHDGETTKSIKVGEIELDFSDMTKTKESLDKIMSQRSDIGAQYNGIEHQLDDKANAILQSTASMSQISDADISSQISKLISLSILHHASFITQQRLIQKLRVEASLMMAAGG